MERTLIYNPFIPMTGSVASVPTTGDGYGPLPTTRWRLDL